MLTGSDAAHRAIEAVWRHRVGRGSSPAWRGWCATSASPRSSRRTRSSPRSSSGRSRGHPGQPGRLAHGHREAPRDRPAPAQRSGSSASTRSSATSCRGRRSTVAAPELDAASTTTIGDDLLRLVFTACHPVLSTEARVALTLRLLGGLTTEEIARAFLVPEPTDRAAHRARQAHARRGARPVRGPAAAPTLARAARVGARGRLPRLQRGLLGDRRRRLDAPRRSARTRCASAASSPSSCPTSPRSHGLVALMEIQASRLRARARPGGRADPAPRAEPRALGPAAHPPRPRGARARRGARRRAGPVRAAGGDRRLPRAGAHRRRRRTGRASPRSTQVARRGRRRPPSSS